jgi:putative PIN family toxin of toxin-antitoxin system
VIIVLDTNCLVQILPRQAEHRWMYDAILGGEISLAVTTEILDEYVEVHDTFFGSDVLGNYVTKAILELPGTQKTTVHIRWKLITDDPDDDKFVDCAIAANADFIVSDDRHFKILKKIGFPKVIAIKLEDFKKFWQKA